MGTSIEGVVTLTPPVFSKRLILGDTEQPIQDIYEESASQKLAIGTKLIYPDGRVFRYAKNGGTALTKALMTGQEANYARAVDELQSTSGTSQEVGDIQVLIDVTTGGTWVENEFAEGFLIVNKATGIGDIYKIVANKIRSSDVLMDVLLETPLRTAWDATTEVTLVKSPWRDVDVMATTAQGTATGIPLIAVTASYYFWAQTGGCAPAVVDASADLTGGRAVGADDTTAGRVMEVDADTEQIYGYSVYPAIRAEAAIIDLKLDS